jgi:hypothetical protein
MPRVAPLPLLRVALILAAMLDPRFAGALPPDFVEVPQFGTGHPTITVSWGDADRDGDPDLAVANTNGDQNYLYLNEGGGTFTELARFGLKDTFALVWGDVDNDGDEDVAVGNATGFNPQNRLTLNNGDGTFVGQSQFGAHGTTSMAWSDFDLDGDLDLATGNGILGAVTQNYLYRNDGGTFAEIPQFGIGQTEAVVWGDFDLDGDSDLAVGRGGFGFLGQSHLYLNNGDGTFTERAEFGFADTASLAAGDFDNDGDLDVAVGNWNATQCRLYVNQGDGTFVGEDQFGSRDTNTCNWGDLDNDGDLDLVVGNGDFGSADQNYVYDNNGDGTFTEVPRLGLGSTDGLACADFDLDGDLDVAAGNEHSPAQNYLYVNQENDGDWLYLRLVGHFHDQGSGFSNRDGIGAKVLVYEAGHLGDPAHLLASREIEAHGGFSAQSSMEAHYGLPGRSSVDVRIVWPGSGGTRITQDLAGVSVPGRVTVHEGTTQTAVPVVSRPEAPRVTPNPAAGPVRIHLDGRTTPELLVLDATGRVVRRLGARDEAGSSGAIWDLLDAAGRRVAAGMYFVRASGGTADAARVVVLR